jgi:hypothetical protein
MTTLDVSMVRAIARAVEAHGGDMTDVEDLIDVWKRVQRRNDERADTIRREAREAGSATATAETDTQQDRRWWA